jgi:hypothetical protein
MLLEKPARQQAIGDKIINNQNSGHSATPVSARKWIETRNSQATFRLKTSVMLTNF